MHLLGFVDVIAVIPPPRRHTSLPQLPPNGIPRFNNLASSIPCAFPTLWGTRRCAVEALEAFKMVGVTLGGRV